MIPSKFVTLQAGRTLGHYEILATLGAGGMGEVYRARDTRLGREVAIKLLLEEVGSDPERLARFDREARVLASLNHPHIATLHGFETEFAGIALRNRAISLPGSSHESRQSTNMCPNREESCPGRKLLCGARVPGSDEVRATPGGLNGQCRH
jgi:serine/threonine protein kinase